MALMSTPKRLIARLRDPDSLSGKVTASALLSSLNFASQIVLRLGSTIILTRILAPDTFGVFAVVMTFIIILEMFSDIGVRSLILTREGRIEDSFLRSCWTIQILRGVLIAAVAGLIAWGISAGQTGTLFPADSGYADPVLPWAIAAIGGVSFLNGFVSPAKFLYEKEMQFRRITICELIAAFSTMIVTIALAFWLRSIWALVLGQLFRSMLEITLSFKAFRGPPMRPEWNREDIRIIIERGKWIVSHSGLTAVINMADRLVLGFAMSATTFGFYYLARQITDMLEVFLNSMHGQMGIQVFGELQRDPDPEAFRRRYYRYRMIFDFVTMFGAGMLLTVAPLMVEVIYDDRYLEVAQMIQVLAVGLLLIGPGLLREAFSAQRRFREMSVLSLIRAATIWTGLAVSVLVFDSPLLALGAIALHRIPEIVVLLIWSGREGWVAPLREIRFLPLVGLGAGAGLAVTWAWRAVFG